MSNAKSTILSAQALPAQIPAATLNAAGMPAGRRDMQNGSASRGVVTAWMADLRTAALRELCTVHPEDRGLRDALAQAALKGGAA